MGTVLKMSDGQEIRLSSDFDQTVNVIGAAFRRDHGANGDDRGRIIQKGFLILHDVNDEETLVNAAQVVSVRPAESPRHHPHGVVSARTGWTPVTAGAREQF